MFVDLEVGPYRVKAATAFGPRILGVRRTGGLEQLAQLPDRVVIDHPGTGIYRFHGGHRLWAAPEVPHLTYVPDDHECEVTTTTNGFAVQAPPDAAGLTKRLAVTLDGESLVVDHHLGNAGPASLTLAAWAITQFPLGGVAIMPVGGPPDSNPYVADRSLIVWPYTSLIDPRLSWGERVALVNALAGPRFKIGSGPRPGRVGYFANGYLFTKEVPAAGDAEYPDRGAVAQVFVEEEFCELESLGPLTLLEPGSSVTHREKWRVAECADISLACQRVLEDVGA